MEGTRYSSERVGNHSYVVEVKPGGRHEVHRAQLRPHIAEEGSAEPYPLFYFPGKATVVEPELGTGEWLVEAV